MSKPYIVVEVGARIARYDPEFGGVVIVSKVEDLPGTTQ